VLDLVQLPARLLFPPRQRRGPRLPGGVRGR